MATRSKNGLLLVLFLLAGILVGSLLASVTVGIPALRWLSFGKTIGIPTTNPLYLDLAIIQLSLGLEIRLNVAEILSMLLAMFCYRAAARRF